tara:strand:+ start:857 stop:1498 length:642 start_codon:yes stop_codon:yes gene_type:complete
MVFNTVKEAWAEVGGLSKPSKMPSYGYSLSAFKCKVGSKLRLVENSTCADCYALKGRYVFPNVQEALDRRMDKLLNNHKWVEAMVFLLLHYCTKSKVFRWHDSGDIQSLDHLQKIVEIAKRTPNIRHWLPTREVGIVREFKKSSNFPSNLIVRISATMVNGLPHKFHQHSSTVSTDKDFDLDWTCPANKQDNKCGDCRACWDINVANVTYPLH